MIKKTAVVLAAAMMLGQNAYAACDISVNNSKVTLNLSEFSGYNEVMIRVFREGKNGSDLYSTEDMMEVIAYQTQVTTDKNGKATVSFYLDKSGDYTIELGEFGKLSTETYSLVEYADINYSLNIINDINTAIKNRDDVTVKTKIEGNYVTLNLNAELYEALDGAEYDKVYSLIANGEATDSVDGLGKLLNTAALIVKMQGMSDSEAKEYFDLNVSKTLFADSGMYKIYSEYMSKTAKEDLIAKVLDTEIVSCHDALDKYTETAAVDAINNALGADTVRGVLSACEKELGIDISECEALKNPSAVYQALCGSGVTSFESIAGKFETEYNNQKKAENSSSDKKGGSGGGGGGGGSSPIIVRDPETIVKKDEAATEQPETIIEDTVGNYKAFTDLNGYAWAENSIYELYEKGIVSGRGDNAFAPGDAVTREEFIKLITTALNIYNPDAKSSFTDVPSGSWYESYVASGVEHGIINGISDTMFGTGNNITRQDVAVIIYRAIGGGNSDTITVNDIADGALISDYATEAVTKMYELGILTGNDDGTFKPTNSTTRAEAAVIISRMLNML